MNGVNHLQSNSENVLYMEIRTPGTKNWSWKNDATPDSGHTPEDPSVINNAEQRTDGAALTTTSIDAKAIEFLTTICKNHDDGTAVTEIFHNQ